jgi:hypothetical protein
MTIPLFIAEQGCPYRCIYCNQFQISGQNTVNAISQMKNLIEHYLKKSDVKSEKIQIAFFGGNFTGLAHDVMLEYLDLGSFYVARGDVASLRISTRPDYITKEKLQILSRFPVRNIELGVQSMDDKILRLIKRGYDEAKVRESSLLIKEYGFELGLQIMLGLPGETPELLKETVQKIIALKPEESRIYPLLVLQGTELYQMWAKGQYHPLSLEQAVERASESYQAMVEAGIKVLKIGLHPSKDLLNKEIFLAGPFHPAMKELVLSFVWKKKFAFLTEESSGKNCLKITVHPKVLGQAIGYQGSNQKYLGQYYPEVVFCGKEGLSHKEFEYSWEG